MAQSSFIPGNPNLITETLYKPQEDYAFVNDCKSKTFQPNPYFIRERDGPFIQAYYQHYEADIPYKNAIFTPQVKPAALAHRQCNPLIAYPYGMPQNVEYEKCPKCKGNKKCNRRRKTKRKSMKNVDEHTVEDLFTSKLKAENGAYELQANTNDDLKHMGSIHNDDNEDNICKGTSYCSNAAPGSKNFKELCDCDIGINEKIDDNDIKNNNLSKFTHARAKILSFDGYISGKIHREMKKYFSHELKNSLHLSIENNKHVSSMQNLSMDTNDKHQNVNAYMRDDAGCKEDAIQGNEQYYVKVNDAEMRELSNSRNVITDTVRQEITDDRDKDDVILNQFIDVANGNIENSQKENTNGDEMRSSTLTKLPEHNTYGDVNVPDKKDSRVKGGNQELFTGVKENSKNTKQVYICDNVETVSYHIERKQSSGEDLAKCVIKKKKNKTNETSITTPKNKKEDEKSIKSNKYASLHPERTKKPTQPRICHVEVMMGKKEKENSKSKKKINDQNSLHPSVTNVEEFFPDVVRKTYAKKRIFHFPNNVNKELKNKVEEPINEVSSNIGESPATQGMLELNTNGTSSPPNTTDVPLNKKAGLTKTNSGIDKSLQKLSATLIKKKNNISGISKKQVNKKLVKKTNEDTSEKNVVNKPNNQEERKTNFKSKRFLSRSTTVFYGNEKPVPFKTTEVKRFTENVPMESKQLESFKSNESVNIIKKKKTKDVTKIRKNASAEVSNVSKQLRNDTIAKKLKSKKKELYNNILSLTKNMKKNDINDVLNKKKGDIEQISQKSLSREEIILGKNVDNGEGLRKLKLKKTKSIKEKMLSTKNKEENRNADRTTEVSPLKHKMKTTKGIKENSKEIKTEEKKRKLNKQKDIKKELSKRR